MLDPIMLFVGGGALSALLLLALRGPMILRGTARDMEKLARKEGFALGVQFFRFEEEHAQHCRRVSELLEANNNEVERRRAAEAALALAVEQLQEAKDEARAVLDNREAADE